MSGRFRDKMANFMAGRYGMDEFGKFINILLFVMIIVSFFCKIFIPSDVTAFDIQLFQNFIKKLSGKKQREPVVP